MINLHDKASDYPTEKLHGERDTLRIWELYYLNTMLIIQSKQKY